MDVSADLWLFDDPPNVAVFTTRDILDKRKSVQRVTRDDEDGAWQFHHADSDASDSEAVVCSLTEMVALEPSVALLHDLPVGWCAYKDHATSVWIREKINPVLDGSNAGSGQE